MRYFSTRDNTRHVSGAEAIVRGQAPDGGLYVPESFPAISGEELAKLVPLSYADLAFCVTKLYLPEFADEEIYEFTKQSYGDNFSSPEIAPLRSLNEDTSVLELWHGPTCAFKDMALQYLPRLLAGSLKKTGETKEVCILAATSGDTGKAALEGFADVDGTRILVFYPRDGVSDIQKLQMISQTGGNVRVCSVNGNFDDTQTAVKAIFGDALLRDELERSGKFLSSANSINWGRLLPQIVYYLYAYTSLTRRGKIALGDKVNFCVPTGNFGNILAGYIAKEMGVPIGKLICASNSNKVLTDFLAKGVYDKRRELVLTASPSMDILISSNLERLLYFTGGRDGNLIKELMAKLNKSGKYEVDENIRAAIGGTFIGGYNDDERTKTTIKDTFREYGYLVDPHTAVGLGVLNDIRRDTELDGHTVAVSAASAYKFCETVLDAFGEDCPDDVPMRFERLSKLTGTLIPEPLAELADKAVRFTDTIEKDEVREYVWQYTR
ncbi:MAG: threonine synthase [Oscillospiraceae bacterium]|jgi:threonine synthase|nr:threonine synthase [Oscillospiraceae bacterium]